MGTVPVLTIVGRTGRDGVPPGILKVVHAVPVADGTEAVEIACLSELDDVIKESFASSTVGIVPAGGAPEEHATTRTATARRMIWLGFGIPNRDSH